MSLNKKNCQRANNIFRNLPLKYKEASKPKKFTLLLFFMGRIDPAECIGVSQQRNGNVLNVKPTAVRVRGVCYTKNHLSSIIGVFRPLLEKGKVILWQSKRIRLHIRNGCVNITSSSPQSIDEKLSIINTKQIREIF